MTRRRNLTFGKRSLFVLLLVLVSVHTSLQACPVCYGNAESAEVEGARWAILFLLGVTGMVLTGIISFVLRMRKRARLSGDTHLPSSF